MRIFLSLSAGLLAAGLCLAGVSAQIKDSRPSQVADFHPVSEQMLRTPPPGDWLNWRRTDDNWGYSPLTDITKQNAQQLQLVWSWAMETTGPNEMTPLVHDGIMYLPNTGGVIQALDGATGELIWEYRPARDSAASGTAGVAPPQSEIVLAGIQRSIAIFGDRIFGTTEDAHIVAVGAKDGKLAWDTKMADHALGYTYTSGPIVARGKVIAGITGCNRYKNDVCFIAALDAQTGRELWRTSTIARPGEPGGDTWGGLPLEFRAGGDVWMPGSYDPATNTVFFGTAQAKPWARAVRGTDGAALYTSSTLALDPDTGKIKWYYQHLPGETQDMDEAFERMIVDIDGRKSMITMGKLGVLWELDRVTGKFVKATDLGYQNILEVNRQTGEIRYNAGMIPQVGVELDMCPSTAGFKSWRAMTFSPQTNAVYIPLNLHCEHATFGPQPRVSGGGGNGPLRRRNHLHPASDGNLGEIQAVDVRSGRTLWSRRYSSPMNTAALATGGGVVFAGDWDRHVYAYDASTGKTLWQTRLPTSAQGFPITYTARGKQYVAMPSGTGGGSWTALVPQQVRPDIRGPKSGNALHVFALPVSR